MFLRHYHAGISRAYAGFNLEIAFEDTDIKDNDNTDERARFTVSRSFNLTE